MSGSGDNNNKSSVHYNNQFQNSKDNNNRNNNKSNNSSSISSNFNNNVNINKQNTGYQTRKDKQERKEVVSPNIFQKKQDNFRYNNQPDNQNKQKQAASNSIVHHGKKDEDRHLNPNSQMVAQSLISGRSGEPMHENASNNNLHASYNNNYENGTHSLTKPVKSPTNNQQINQKPKLQSISGNRDIDKLIRCAQNNPQYCLTLVNKQKPFYLRQQPSMNQYKDQEEQKGNVSQSSQLYQTFSINCELSLSSSGNSSVSIFLIFNIMEPNRFPELIICDQRIASTPGLLQRIRYEKMRKQWNIKDNKSLCILLDVLTQGLLQLNQMEFEHKLLAVLGEDIVSSCIHGKAISKSVAYLQQNAMQNEHSTKGIQINLQEFDQNMKNFRHYINCGQIQEVKNLQLFNLSFAIDSTDITKQFILTILFFADCFEMRMKQARSSPASQNNNDNNKNQFTQNFFYDFMRSNGGFQPDPYSMLERKVQSVKKKISAISQSQNYRKIFMNKLLLYVGEYGILYDVDTKQAYKMTIAVKIKGKLSLVMIELGDLFPNDTVQISMKKFLETNSERYGGVFGLTAKKTYSYQVNGVKVRDFSDKDMHQVQANDILHFMKDVILESQKAQIRQANSYYGFR